MSKERDLTKLVKLDNLVPARKSLARNHAKRKHYIHSHLSMANVTKWRKEGWPYGIKIDLARRSYLYVPKERELIYREYVKDCTEQQIGYTGRERGDIRVFAERWIFPHPSKTDPIPPSWYPVFGYSIPGSECAAWLQCLDRLTQVARSDFDRYRELFVGELQFGQETEGGKWFRVRFYPWRSGDKYYYCIRTYTWHRTKQIYVPRQTHLYWEQGGGFEGAFRSILQRGAEEALGPTPAKDAVVIDMGDKQNAVDIRAIRQAISERRK